MNTNKNILFNIIKNQNQILENFLEIICKQENLNFLEMKKKYLNHLLNFKKKISKRKGILNGYTYYLGDKEIHNKIIKENSNIINKAKKKMDNKKDESFKIISKLKGELWSKLNKKEKEKYKLMAIEKNKKNNLITT